MDEGKYRVDNTGPVQGQVIGDHLQVTQHFYGSGSMPSSQQRVPLPVSADRNRQRMLERVRSTWIRGVLEQSLHGAVLIALELREQPDTLANPWRLVVQEVDQIAHALPVGTHITQVYDDSEGALLILGEPGAGKTTLLLELTRDLLNRAQEDENLPIPVVFNLSSWARKQSPLTEWLVEELDIRYEVPRQLGQSWVTNDTLLPLLDGLDEVAPAARKQCIQAINRYREAHPLVPVVVCSRSDDYLSQPTQLRLHTAVMVQPLTREQIDAYLVSAGAQVEALRVALSMDLDLQELATTPLMLSVLTLAYQGTPLDEITALDSLKTRKQQIFDTYVQRMLKRRSAETRYTPQQTTQWLSWLARRMKKQGQTIFYLERMQPDWLPEGRLSRAYERLAIRLLGILIGVLVSLVVGMLISSFLGIAFGIFFGPIGGLLGGLFSGRNIANPSEERRLGSWKISWCHFIIGPLRNGLLVGLIYGLISGLSERLSTGLSIGLSIGLGGVLLSVIFEKGNAAQLQTETHVRSWRSLWRRLINAGHVRNGLLAGLIYGLSLGLSSWLIRRLSLGLGLGLISGLSVGLIGILLSVILVGRDRTIQPTETIVWSWRSLMQSLINVRHMRNALLVGILVGLIYGLISGLSERLISGLIAGLSLGLGLGLSVGLSYWLLLGLFNGLSSDTLDERRRIAPNQGIRRSARYSILVGLIGGLVSSPIVILSVVLSYGLGLGLSVGQRYGLSYGLSLGLRYGLSLGLIAGLAGGLLAGLLNGGLACIQHGVLRWLLWRSRCIPWKYVRFLDLAAERILLRKVGGGYIFIHRLLLDYFASLEVASTSQEAVLSPTSQLRRIALLNGLALIIIVGSVGIFSLIRINQVAIDNAHAAATATIVAANPDPYPPYTGKLALYDPLSQPLNWGNTSDPSFGGACQFTGEAYYASESKAGIFYICGESTDFSNFAFEVQMRIIKGDCGGILFREDSATGKLYYFRVCHDGSYSLLLYVGFSGSTSKILISKTSSAIHTGLNQSNTVAIVANGSTLNIYVNRQKIDSITDSTYSHGQIGIAAEDRGDPTEMVYSNARVWTL